jgi:hypothetical protein
MIELLSGKAGVLAGKLQYGVSHLTPTMVDEWLAWGLEGTLMGVDGVRWIQGRGHVADPH